MTLVINFIIVPLLAYIITLLLPLDQPLRIGLILLSTAAGAPFLPKLAQAARRCVFGRADGAADSGDHHLSANCLAS